MLNNLTTPHEYPGKLFVVEGIDGSGKTKDRETDGFAFLKRQCLHCADPSCVSVCPLSAMHKDPVTGIVRSAPKWQFHFRLGQMF